MADDLKRLERDVDAARARLMGDIAALRAPGGLTDLPETLKQAALEKRDGLIDEARSRGRSAIDAIREKAVANPAATLVIGAGLAWHFLRRPPITAALIGGGLFSLLRTPVDTAHAGSGGDALERAKQNLKTQTETLRSQAADIGREAGRKVEETASQLARDAKDRASALAADAQEAAADVIGDAAARASSIAGQARDKAAALAEDAKAAIGATPLGRCVGRDGEDSDDGLFDAI